jgi:hypothetical protein
MLRDLVRVPSPARARSAAGVNGDCWRHDIPLLWRPMTSGFSHFDGGHRENFCAAVLLLAMDLDPALRSLVAKIVLRTLGGAGAARLVSAGREARLEETEQDNYARVDIWLLFEGGAESFYAFLEVKTRDSWDAARVAHQVRDQAGRELVRNSQRIHGSVLLAPHRLCRRVLQEDAATPCLSWQALFAEIRALPDATELTTHAVRHIEEQMERPPGLERPLTLLEFERATTTVA